MKLSRFLVSLGGPSALLLAIAPAHAAGERLPLNVRASSAEVASSPPGLEVVLQRNDVEAVDVSSRIVSRGRVVAPARVAGLTVLNPAGVPTAMRQSLPPGHVVAASGDTVPFGRLHGISLVPGVY